MTSELFLPGTQAGLPLATAVFAARHNFGLLLRGNLRVDHHCPQSMLIHTLFSKVVHNCKYVSQTLKAFGLYRKPQLPGLVHVYRSRLSTFLQPAKPGINSCTASRSDELQAEG